jgi:hypothetical protein
MADDLGGDGEIVLGRASPLVGAAQHLGQRVEAFHDLFGRDAVVDQAGDLVHADALELLHAVQAVLDRAEQAGVLEVALEREVQDAFEFLGVEAADVDLGGVADALGLLERGEGPGVLLDQAGRAAQVVLHRAARGFARLLAVARHIGVQHQRDRELRRVVAGLAQRLVVEANLAGHLVDRLAQQVGQHVGADGRPASRQVSGLPAVVTQIGSSLETGRGCVLTAKVPSWRWGSPPPRRARGAGSDRWRNRPGGWRAACSRGAARNRPGASPRPPRARRGRWSGCRSPPTLRRCAPGGAAAPRSCPRARRCFS